MKAKQEKVEQETLETETIVFIFCLAMRANQRPLGRCQVLSDAKARAKYDATGRTSKPTAEEEFVEALEMFEPKAIQESLICVRDLCMVNK